MQISTGEIERLLQRAPLAPTFRGLETGPVHSVEELAQKYGVDAAEAEQHEESLRLAEEDPWRQRRLRDLAARLEAGTYRIDAAAIVDMAERRALADRVSEL
jgi:hypothetical protein